MITCTNTMWMAHEISLYDSLPLSLLKLTARQRYKIHIKHFTIVIIIIILIHVFGNVTDMLSKLKL